MNENTNTEKLTREIETHGERIARIVSKLPEREQCKIYYMVKGIELAGNVAASSGSRAAGQ